MTHVMIFLFDVLTIWQISSQNRSESVKFQKRRTIEVCQIAKTKHVINFSKRNLKLEIGSNLSNSKNECISGHMTIASFKWILSNSKVHPVIWKDFPVNWIKWILFFQIKHIQFNSKWEPVSTGAKVNWHIPWTWVNSRLILEKLSRTFRASGDPWIRTNKSDANFELSIAIFINRFKSQTKDFWKIPNDSNHGFRSVRKYF